MVWLGVLTISLIMFVLGAAVGSFLNVVVYRSVLDEDWVSGRSRCDNCHKQLRWFENIPVVSYLVQWGRARCCKQRLSLAHPTVEIMTGLLFVWWYWGGALFFRLTTAPFQTLQPLFWLAVGILLLLIVVADILYMIIPDIAVGLLMAGTIVYRLGLTAMGIMKMQDLLWSVFGMVLAVSFFVGLWMITKGKGLGLGDVKLIAPLALLVGWPHIWLVIFLSFTIGAVVGVGLLMSRKAGFKSAVPFGPFLVLGAVITLVFGDPILHWYLQLL